MPVTDEARGAGTLKKSILSVRGNGGPTVGLAFLVSETLAFTCAHVVNSALGTPRGEDATGESVEFEPAFGSGDGPVGEATVEHWSAEARPRHASDDVAVLRLREAVGGTGPVRLQNPSVGRGEVPVRAFGIPSGYPRGVWHAGTLRGVVASGWMQINQGTDPGYRVEQGFSGGPVWDQAQQAVIGMITVADLGEVRSACAIPSTHLLAAVPLLRGELWQPSPYPGLAPYPETMSEALLGRDTEAHAVVDRLDVERWVTIAGPSGSGKSSLLLAGVVPRLRAAGDDVVVVRPGDGRVSSADDLADRVAQNRTVVVVDQLEELFELAVDEHDAFVQALFGNGLPSRTRVVSTLRHDFLGQVLAHLTLRRAVQGRRLHMLGPLQGDGLRAVVTRAGASAPAPRFEDGLVDRIVADAQASAAPMPLLSHTLASLWDGAPGSRLTHRAYDEAGGVGGALDRAARQWLDEVPVGLAEEHLPHLLAKLVRIMSHAAEPTRRVVDAAELCEPERRLAQRLTTAGLLVAGGVVDPGPSAEATGEAAVLVELAHDALFSAWGSLREFVEENRSFLVWSENLRYDAERWAEGGRTRAELLPSDAELDIAERWEREHSDALTSVQREFLSAGRERRATRARRRRQAQVGTAIAAVVLLALVSAVAMSKITAAEQQRRTTSRVLAENAAEIERMDPALGILAGVAAWRTSPTQEARDRLLAQYVEYGRYARMLPAGLGTPRVMAHSADGDVVVAISQYGRLTIHVDVFSGPLRSAHVPDESRIQYADVSANGARVVAFRENGTAIWFDVRRDSPSLRGPVHRLQDAKDRVPAPPNASEHKGGWHYQWPLFSPDGRYVVARVRDRFVRWDVHSGRIVNDGPAPDGTLAALWAGASDATLLMPLVTGSQALRHDGAAVKTRQDVVAVSLRTGKNRVVARAGDQWLLSGDGNTLIRCRESASKVEYSRLRVADGAAIGRPVVHDSTACLMEGVNRSGQFLLTHTDTPLVDGRAVIDFEKGAVAARYPVPGSWARSAGNTVLAERGGRYYQLGSFWAGVPAGYIEVAISDDSADEFADQILLGDGRRTLGIADRAGSSAEAADHSLELRAEEFPGQVIAEARVRKPGWALGAKDGIRVAPRGELVADREGTNVVVVRDGATLRERVTVHAVPPPKSDTPSKRAAVRDLAGNTGLTAAVREDGFTYFFDAAGNLLTVSGDVVQHWDTRTGDETARFDLSALRPDDTAETLASIAPTPMAGNIAVTYPGAARTRVVDIAGGKIVAELPTGPQTASVQFDPDRNRIVLHRQDQTIEVRDSTSWELLLGPLPAGKEDTYIVRFTGEDRFLLAANNSVRAYDLGSETEIESFRFGGKPSRISLDLGEPIGIVLDVSSRGDRVIYQRWNGPSLVVPLDPNRWQRTLCEVVGHRDLAAGELDHLTGDAAGIRDTCGEGDT
ncbi:trypsin-like peptidase domain-containing protein [Spirillospora sp. NPDC048832]